MIIRRSNRNIFLIHSNDRTWTIIFEFIFFRDQLFQSLIIFRGKKIQKNWTKKWSHSAYAVSSNDWTNNDVELNWLKKIFHSKTINLKNWKFLLIDNHESHVFVKFIEYVYAIDIVFLCFSFHTIYYFQSLDVNCFELLIKAYKRQLNEKNKIKIVQITKLNFLICFRKIKNETMIAVNIMFV